VILYPKNRVSPVQEKQLTALGKIFMLWKLMEVLMIVKACKQAFPMKKSTKLFLTSANSINIARWLPSRFIICWH
jgi:threonine synthase